MTDESDAQREYALIRYNLYLYYTSGNITPPYRESLRKIRKENPRLDEAFRNNGWPDFPTLY